MVIKYRMLEAFASTSLIHRARNESSGESNDEAGQQKAVRGLHQMTNPASAFQPQ